MVNHDLINKYFNTAISMVESENLNTPTEIEEHLSVFKDLLFKMDDDTFKALVDKVLEKVSISLEAGTILSNDENANWFIDTRVERGTIRHDAYEKYLKKTEGYSMKVIDSMGKAMDKVMNNIGDPKSEGSFSKKGIVIGDVQSGKTSNFISLMNKAADAGYEIIVVTTGIIEKLRRQTQIRIEQGFVGKFTATSNRETQGKTVADFDNDQTTIAVTNANKDFNIKTVSTMSLGAGSSNSPVVVAVIKKNKKSLEDLREWLGRNNTVDPIDGRINKSLLFIDDEADNATINTRSEEDPTTINIGIRNILNYFKRNSYVGFTATPFANVLIDHSVEDDLFPEDFILVLDTPSNYMGASTIFPEDANYHNVLVSNDDAEEFIPIKIPKEERNSFIVEELPSSLIEAIRIFFLQNAIRDLRGHKKKHRSMLVNVSHLNNIQEQVNDLITEEVDSLKRQIKIYINNTDSNIHRELQTLFSDEFKNEVVNIDESWEEVYKTLYSSTDPIFNEIINVQNKSFQYEDYPNGARIIAVGGFALSRGLTLEGLSTSYLYRNTLISDTLMQMGRWFGYRPNYDDIIKIYMPSVSVDWYSQILQSTIDLKEQIKNMENNHQKPRDFGLYIKEPSNYDETVILLITARNKMKNSQSQEFLIRISGDYKETTKFSLSDTDYNREVSEAFVEKYASKFDKTLLYKNAPKEVASELLSKYIFGGYNKLNDKVASTVLTDFDRFDIKIAAKQNSTINDIKHRDRSFKYDEKFDVIALSNARLGTPTDGAFGLDAIAQQKVKKLDIKSQKQYFSQFDKYERNPLIILYPIKLNATAKALQPTREFHDEHKDEVYWGLSLGVPNDGKKPLTYRARLNTVRQQQLFEGEQLDDFSYLDESEDEL
ncbi:Z1 domain-containing protein [Aerococcus sp.]|uniref:Z1 domain-containing protein n=1 Tax=Aerococcus sp. TaxID=1872398 RepID=UPI0025BAA0B6|nr:Z1 domain-containing protein [Aerococcus sp.]MBR2129727.1 Z1 domain-containing protein [Aerococcus sp.]